MQNSSLLGWSLLLMRCAVLPTLLGAVLFWWRHPLHGDPRAGQAAMAGLSVALVGLTSLSLSTTLPLSGGTELVMLASNLLAIGSAGVLVWMSCHAGMVLGHTQGGYWRKAGSGRGAAIRAGIGGALLVLSVSMPLFVALDLQLPAGQIPVSPRELTAWVLRMVAFSFGEEVVYRGWALAWLCTGSMRPFLRPWSANLLVAMVFAVQHTGGSYQMLMAFWAGLVLGAAFLRHGLVAAAVVHLAINLAGPAFSLLSN